MECKLLENYMNFLPIRCFRLLFGMCKHYKLFYLTFSSYHCCGRSAVGDI
jgi:hypothetical protein